MVPSGEINGEDGNFKLINSLKVGVFGLVSSAEIGGIITSIKIKIKIVCLFIDLSFVFIQEMRMLFFSSDFRALILE
jgi:hypothetical protein